MDFREKMKTFSFSWQAGFNMFFSSIILLIIIFPLFVYCLKITITRTNGQEEKGILEKMGDDGSITLKVQSGTITLRRDQYQKVVSAETPSEITIAQQNFNNKKYADALKNYQSAYEKYKWLNWGEIALEGIGNCHRALGENEKAIESYDTFIKQFPRSGAINRVKYSIGLTYRTMGKKAESLKAFNEVIDATDDVITAFSLVNAGDIYFEQGEYEKALRSYLKVIILYETLKGAETKVREAKIGAGKCYDKIIENTSSQQERTVLQSEKERITR